MFNWFKKITATVKATPELGATTPCGGSLITRLAIDESIILLKQSETHFHNGKFEDVVKCCRRAIALNPHFAEAYASLGFALMNLEQVDSAEESFRRVIALVPEHSSALQYLGAIAAQRGDFLQAEASYRRVLELQPDQAQAHNNLGVILMEIKCLPEAEASYRRAIELQPNYVNAHINLGVMFMETKRLPEAEASYRRVLELQPDHARTYNHLGAVLSEAKRLPEAEASYRRALELKPDYDEAHSNLGNILKDQERLSEAKASFRRALEIKPNSLAYASQTHLLLPVILVSSEATASWRELYQTGISILASGDFDDDLANLYPYSFYLAYHNQNDKSLMEALHHMFRKRVTSLTATAPHVINWQTPAVSNRRIRVGFLSEYLVSHTIGKLFQGFIHYLDRLRFEVVVIHAPKAIRDTIRQSIDALADKELTLPPRLKDQQAAVMAECLDVLFYPDIGMSPTTYFLAYARLAPVQAVSWGHPDTTGLDTMDYFVSAASIEPPDADEHYTERLIRLNRMPCYYQPIVVPTQIFTRQSLGLPEVGTLYGCPQTLYKFHPDFDSVLAAIAKGDPDGHIVLIEGKYASWTNLLKARWANTYPILLDRVIFLPSMPLEQFNALMARIDLLLDPIHFGSGNTMYEAMVYGTPIVTWPGQFMRGRLVVGCYKQMGIKDPPVAESLEDFARIALALGHDSERRLKLKNELLAAAGKELLVDMQAVREFEAFLEAAVTAAENGQKLSVGWRPNIKSLQLLMRT